MRIFVAFAAIVALSFAGVLEAQSPNTTLTGRVSDPSMAVIANAKVTVINQDTNIPYEGMTNGVGIYYVTNLPAGTYRMEIEKAGFKTLLKPGIILHVQDVVEVNFEMALGLASETITVEAGVSPVELATATLSGVVNSTTVLELPLNGRDWTQLATLQPGVNSSASIQADVSAGFQRGNRGFGTQMTISGARPQQNSYLIDGINVNDYLGGSPGSVEGGATGVDAIQEFSVLTSNYSAEYGRTSGGVINAVTNQHKTWMAFPSVAFTLGSQARWSLASGHAPQG
jgi:hypothetical protein